MMDLDINTKWPEKPKRTISLEAYIKMQNDWLVHWEDYDNGSRKDFEVSVRAAQSTINELLKFNSVEVES